MSKESPEWLDTEFLEVTFSAFRTIERAARDAGLRQDDLQALVWIRKHAECTASDVSAAMGVSRPSATRIMRRLAQSDLVREHVDARDLRQCRYRVTTRANNVVYELDKRLSPMTAETLNQRFMQFRKIKGSFLHQLSEPDKQETLLESDYGPCPGELPARRNDISDTQMRILLVTASSAVPARVTWIARIAALEQPKASMAIGELQRMGVIEKTVDEADGRARMVIMTRIAQLAFHYADI